MASAKNALLAGLSTGKFTDQVSFPHHENSVTESQHFRQFGRHHQDGHALLGKVIDQGVDIGLAGHIDAARRFVDQEQLTARRQPAAQNDLLLVAARQPPDDLVGVGGPDAELLNLLLDPGGASRLRGRPPCPWPNWSASC